MVMRTASGPEPSGCGARFRRNGPTAPRAAYAAPLWLRSRPRALSRRSVVTGRWYDFGPVKIQGGFGW